jgi:hypothetical protein
MNKSVFHFSRFMSVFLTALALWSSGGETAFGKTSLPFDEEALRALEGSPFAAVLSPLEFHAVATGEVIGEAYPKLVGERVGPYECLARSPGKHHPPGIFDLRVIISTKAIFYDDDGNETSVPDKAVSKSEVATGVELVILTGSQRDTGDKTSALVLLRDTLMGHGTEVIEREVFFLGNRSLRSGMTAAEVEAALKPAKIVRGKAEMVEATGDIMETWKVESADLELAFIVDPETKLKKLANLSVGPAAKIETSRGIRIGSPESRVVAAYSDWINQRDSTPGRLLVMGNLYLGMFVQIEKGRVSSIHLGMGAE